MAFALLYIADQFKTCGSSIRWAKTFPIIEAGHLSCEPSTQRRSVLLRQTYDSINYCKEGLGAMYNSYFGFSVSPFSVTPDPNFFYTNPVYQEAYANLRYGI